MYFDHYHFWGMHFFWWFAWGILLFWIFVTPYEIPGQRTKKNTPLDVLNKRFAIGELSREEYQEIKNILKNN